MKNKGALTTDCLLLTQRYVTCSASFLRTFISEALFTECVIVSYAPRGSSYCAVNPLVCKYERFNSSEDELQI